ncbi:MAG: DivIVA domain-containing protein [Candidatus Nanopelagicales bacterium]
MALTPEDVRNKQFSTAKRKGYEMDEVDAFLDQVEVEIGNLHRENADLRGRTAAAEQAAAQAAAAPPPPPPAPPAPDHNAEAVAMLALAQKTAEEHKAKAKAEADALIADARTKAAELAQKSETERLNLERRVEELRAFEREYRTRLRQLHEGALKDLEHRGAEAPAAPAGAPAGGLPTAPPAQAPAAPHVPQVAPPAPPAPPASPVAAPAGPPPASPFAVPPTGDAPPQG